MIDGCEQPPSLTGRDVASVFVFDADHDSAPGSLVCKLSECGRYAIETPIRINRSPIGEHANDAGTHALGDGERPLRQPGLILERERGSEDVLLNLRRNRRRIGEGALEHGRSN